MRIEFASGARAAVDWAGGSLLLGSAEGCDVRLDGRGVAARHARLSADQRGLVLDVERGAGRVYVNARPVRERALLRLGDVLGVGTERLRLVTDEPARDDGDATNDEVCVAALRAVAGPLSGRVWPLADHLWLDATGPVAVAPAAGLSLRLQDGQVWLDASSLGDAAAVRVNGAVVTQGRLHGGDQLAAGVHRFVLDAAACLPAPDLAHVDPSVPATNAPTRKSGREMGWLIATAVVVALLLVWGFLTHG
ncbi:MAG TPA: FHA domain-containing protein [Rhodanobacteraceae bacterium]